MDSLRNRIRAELASLLKLAGPVVAAELGWMAMGVVDTIMVGRLGAEAIGAVAMGSIIFNCGGLLAIGLMLGLDTLVSQSFGAGDIEDCNHSLRQALWLAAIASPGLLLMMLAIVPTLPAWGVDPSVVRLATPFSNLLAWGVFPIAAYAAFRRYLQSMNLVRPVMFALVSANLINLAANYALIYGHWGLPALGVEGSAWSTNIARAYMAAVLLAAIWLKEREERTGLFRWEALDAARLRLLLRLGAPAAGHILVEVGAFALATALAGQFTPSILAAHEIALNNAALTYMVPLGISSAAAVRVGQAIGRRDERGARLAGWTAVGVGAAYMSLSALTMMLIPEKILGVYTTDAGVIATGASLLTMAAMFGLFDGVQVVSTGALRGIGDTHSVFWANTAGYWVLGLPAGAWFCFRLQWGVTGLWLGLTLGLMAVAVVLIVRWALLSRQPSRLLRAVRAETEA